MIKYFDENTEETIDEKSITTIQWKYFLIPIKLEIKWYKKGNFQMDPKKAMSIRKKTHQKKRLTRAQCTRSLKPKESQGV